MIKEDLLNVFPGWFHDLERHPEKYYLVLSDDFDSLYTCRFLKKKFNIPIGGFFSFKGVYHSTLIDTSRHIPVYVDASIVQSNVMSFDNHWNVMSIKNRLMINPNFHTSLDLFDDKAYFQKYNGSTLMLVCALYGNPNELTEIEKMTLLTCDGFYLGWFNQNGKFRKYNIFWLQQLGFAETLIPILESHEKQYFDDFVEKYHIKEKIFIGDDGRLFTWCDCLPKDKFKLTIPLDTSYVSKDEIKNTTIADKKIFSCAETYRGKYTISKLK